MRARELLTPRVRRYELHPMPRARFVPSNSESKTCASYYMTTCIMLTRGPSRLISYFFRN